MARDKRGRRRDPWEDMFGSFDDEFEEMRRRMDAMMEGFMSGEMEQIGQPMIYGFSMRVGPDGKPRIQEFGNTTPPRTDEAGRREPLTDIIEEKDTVRVIVELPGVEKDDIRRGRRVVQERGAGDHAQAHRSEEAGALHQDKRRVSPRPLSYSFDPFETYGHWRRSFL